MQTTKALPAFRSPPITEVVCGVRFQPLDRLTIPHVGLFWQQFRDRFPIVQHAAPLVFEGGIPIDTASGAPLPRVWFVSVSDDELIQFQPDRLLFNWRRRSGDYPRYPAIVDGFARTLASFLDFLRSFDLGEFSAIECELSYVNHIPKGQGWQDARDLGTLLRDFCWRADAARFLPTPTAYAWQASFALPTSLGRLLVRLSQATRREDQHPLLVLELTAKGIGDDKTPSGLLSWFDVAHEWIVRGFADVTTLDAQGNLWKREHA